MELSKDLPIFSIIKNHLDLFLTNDTYELEISFLKSEGNFSEIEFNNFTSVFRSMKYNEIIEPECLEISANNFTAKVRGIPKIIKYSATETLETEMVTKRIQLVHDEIVDLFSYIIKISVYSISQETVPPNWEDLRKQYSINKDIVYTKDNINYVCQINKSSEDEYYSIKQSNVLKSNQNFNFKVVLKKSPS